MTWFRRVITIAAGGAVAASLLFSPAADPAVTTLQRTILDLNGDGRLEYAAGDPITVRTELGAIAQAGREARRRALLSFVGFTDFQLADEESVARGPWADKCDQVPTKSAFRPQETMVPHLINSNIRAANAIAVGPVSGRPFDFGIQLGDAADNTQRNEVRWFIDLLDGGVLLDPDSGDPERYEGPQGGEPWPSPTGRAITELANDPFFAPGLRRADGSQIPWYSVLGNHDAKIQGTIPNLPGWWEFVNVFSQGPVFVRDLAPDYQQELCANPALIGDPSFWMKVLARPGTTSLVTADASRVTLTRKQWMAEHLPPSAARKLDGGARGSTGVPAGHGFLNNPQCTDEQGTPLDRLCYSYDAQGIHFIVLDTNPDDGLQDGNLDEAQMAWLERDLIANSARYYDGATLAATSHGRNPLIVLFTHHTRETMEQDFAVRLRTTDHPTLERLDQSGRAFGGDFEDLLHRFPNVILHAAGHTHENRVWARTGRKADAEKGMPATGYWEVNSSSHADWPMQSRTLEVVDNRDGTLSIFGVLFDATAPARACKTKTETGCIAWSDDATNEKALGAPAAINEEYLAAVAREVGWNDPQEGAALGGEQRGRGQGDRNVELLVPNPLGASVAGGAGMPGGNVVRNARRPGPGNIFTFGPDTVTPGALVPQPQTPAFDHAIPGAGGTAKGLGEPSATGSVPRRSIRGGVLLLVALLAVAWAYRARVRGWMIGLSSR